jgi:hypothetical protein
VNYREDLKAFLDGELPEPRAQEIRLALARDADLAAESEALQQISQAIQGVPEPAAHGLEQTLWALENQKRKPKPRPVPWFIGLGLAGACSLLMAINLLGRGQMEDAAGLARESGATIAASPDSAKASLREDEFVASTGKRPRLDLEVKSPPEASASATAGTRAPTTGVREKITVSKVSPPKGKSSDSDRNRMSSAGSATGSATGAAQNAPAVKHSDPAPPAASKAKNVADQEPEIVELRVASVDVATTAIKHLAEESGSTMLTPEFTDPAKQTIELDVPKERAEELIKKLKELPRELAMRNQSQFANAQQSQSGALGGLGSADSQGNRGASGPGGPGGTPPKTKAQADALKSEQERKVRPLSRRKIRIVFVSDKEPEPQTS